MKGPNIPLGPEVQRASPVHPPGSRVIRQTEMGRFRTPGPVLHALSLSAVFWRRIPHDWSARAATAAHRVVPANVAVRIPKGAKADALVETQHGFRWILCEVVLALASGWVQFARCPAMHQTFWRRADSSWLTASAHNCAGVDEFNECVAADLECFIVFRSPLGLFCAS